MELMFPATLTGPAPTDAAPSLADIVHEQTQGGRLIVRFFLSTMEGEFEDAKIHHRVDAAKQLIILQQKSSFADVVRDETDNGDRVIRFLFSTMMGEFEDAKQHHRNEAGKQLAKLDPGLVRALSQDNATRRSRPLHTGAVGAPSAALPTGAVGDAAPSIADIARQETDNGRDAIRFLVDVMRGVLTEFDTHQRIDAAIEIIERCADHTPRIHTPPPPPAPRHDTEPASNHGTGTPWAAPRKPEWRHFEYPKDHTYDFDSYGEEDFDRDTYGHKARVHIFGDDETASVANQAVLDYKVDQIEAQRAAVHSEYDSCQPSDPCPSCLVPDPPDDDSFGQHTYGYNALVYIYGSKAAAREGYRAAMDHKEKLRLGLLASAGCGYVDDTASSGPDPPEHPPPKPRVLVHFGLPEDYD